jgi:hypothetical protein
MPSTIVVSWWLLSGAVERIASTIPGTLASWS